LSRSLIGIPLGPQRGLGPVGDAEPVEDAGQMCLDRPLTDAEPLRDRPVRQAGAQHLEHFLLAGREADLLGTLPPAGQELPRRLRIQR